MHDSSAPHTGQHNPDPGTDPGGTVPFPPLTVVNGTTTDPDTGLIVPPTGLIVPVTPVGTPLHHPDHRRVFTNRQKQIILTRQRGVCAGPGCGKDLVTGDTEFHHIVPWAIGGPTHPDNGMALCRTCHLDAPFVPLPTITPRAWQIDALRTVTDRLRLGQFATIAAAPGAGKTKFAVQAAVTAARDGVIDRVGVLTPTTALTRQWAADFGHVGVPLDDRPVGGRERRGARGFVLTYQSLSNPDTVAELATSIDETNTLLILDEAHHLAVDMSGQESRWSLAVTRIAGTVTSPRCPVINLTGTPFRSRPDQKISTIRYLPVPGVPDRVQVQADHTVTTGELIDQGILRHPTVFAFDAGMTAVTPAGTSSLSVIDLNDAGAGVRTAALSTLLRDEARFIRPVCERAIGLVADNSRILGTPVKAIFVCDDTEAANKVHAVLQTMVGRHAHLAHSKTGTDPAPVLEQFRNDPQQAFLVTVKMVTEGFDVPEAAVLVVMNTITAPLFVAQVAARVMRVSTAEQAMKIVLPATILIPADPGMIDAYAAILNSGAQTVEIAKTCTTCGTSPCACRPAPGHKQCSGCGMPWRLCACLCPSCGGRAVVCGCVRGTAGGPPILVTVDSDAEIAQVRHDGQTVDLDLFNEAVWDQVGLPFAFRAQALSAIQRLADDNPAAVAAALLGIPTTAPTPVPATTSEDA